MTILAILFCSVFFHRTSHRPSFPTLRNSFNSSTMVHSSLGRDVVFQELQEVPLLLSCVKSNTLSVTKRRNDSFCTNCL